MKTGNIFVDYLKKLSFLLAAFILLGADSAHLHNPLEISLQLPICKVQGSGLISPYTGKMVTVRGVVFANLLQRSTKGFYIQEIDCDLDPSTSDGIFVFLGQNIELVKVGDYVEVNGYVQEYYGMTEISTSPENVLILANNLPLPQAKELSPPFENEVTETYFESLESMYVSLAQGSVVGPTDANHRTWLVNSNLNVARVFYNDLPGTGEVICVDDNGLYEIEPQVNVGDHISGLTGVLDFRLGKYCLEIIAPITINLTKDVEQEYSAIHKFTDSNMLAFRAATYNLDNMFDNLDDPLTDDQVLSSTEYIRRLHKHALVIHNILEEPVFMGVQEIENARVLQDLTHRHEIIGEYQYVIQDGPDQRGLDLALLYRRDRAMIVDYEFRQGCTSLVDGLDPDGNGDVQHPQNGLTCDINGDGILDGNRLFSRPPLVALARIFAPSISSLKESPVEVYLIINHWKSRKEDTETVQYTLPRRLEQARFTSRLVEEIREAHPEAGLVFLGDLNDYPGSQALTEIQQSSLTNLWDSLVRSERYTYVYEGLSQPIDHILINPINLMGKIFVAHINADYADSYSGKIGTCLRSSDHDPYYADLTLVESRIYLPVIRR